MEKVVKMTERMFLNEVIAGNLTDEVVTFATTRIEKMNEQNQKRKDAPKKPSKVSEENATLIQAVTDFLAGVDGNSVAKDVAVAVGVTPQKASGLLKTMVNNGTVEKIVPENRNASIEYALVR